MYSALGAGCDVGGRHCHRRFFSPHQDVGTQAPPPQDRRCFVVQEVMPACRRVFHGSFLMAEPRLLEPVYRAEVVYNGTNHPAVMELLAAVADVCLSQTTRADGALLRIKAYLPAAESIGIAAQLEVHGAKCQSVFDHWAPLDPDASLEVIRALRLRKGLSENPPGVDVDSFEEGRPKPDELLTKAADECGRGSVDV
eukprot:CAMPEP_0175920908 /NCGR_PEP_ID=MMETSP0108-20121206/13177_1 /TAXON_ID=195067 ORGANISM="Goniomonas pacifica, Strain CCMP1869" /NCGR_SAMPLE_ID=MMETSP0108 /ASSEMBLY_ACC=CAM_ASM_000204 /LENGTH=196 /DNA_ID=CAMNT_0017243651 /DNA_START=776 /DNA_END=1368 /DNA_ORIENTATION=-